MGQPNSVKRELGSLATFAICQAAVLQRQPHIVECRHAVDQTRVLEKKSYVLAPSVAEAALVKPIDPISGNPKRSLGRSVQQPQQVQKGRLASS